MRKEYIKRLYIYIYIYIKKNKQTKKKLEMSGKRNLQISAWFISTHNEQYF